MKEFHKSLDTKKNKLSERVNKKEGNIKHNLMDNVHQWVKIGSKRKSVEKKRNGNKVLEKGKGKMRK